MHSPYAVDPDTGKPLKYEEGDFILHLNPLKGCCCLCEKCNAGTPDNSWCICPDCGCH